MSLLSPTKDAKKGIRGKTKKRDIKTSLEFTVVCFLWAMEDHMHTYRPSGVPTSSFNSVSVTVRSPLTSLLDHGSLRHQSDSVYIITDGV